MTRKVMLRIFLLGGTIGFAASAAAQHIRAGVENAARECNAATIAVLRPLSNEEKESAVATSWMARGQAYENVRKATEAAQRRAQWFGPSTDTSLELANKCQATFEAILSAGGNVNLALPTAATAGNADALNYLLSKGANPAMRAANAKGATYGMLAIRYLTSFNFAERPDALNSYLDVLIPRLGTLKGQRDGEGQPIVHYALGIDPFVRSQPNQATVDVIIKRLAAAGADIATPWKQPHTGRSQQAFNLYNGSDPEVAALLRGGR